MRNSAGDFDWSDVVKILYICPFAHDLASYSFMARYESEALSKVADVELLTFKGLLDNAPIALKQWQARQNLGILTPMYYLACLMRETRYTRMFAKLLEYFLTVWVAVKMRKDYDVLHLREGDPFLFMLHLINSFQSGCKWAVVLIGAELVEQSAVVCKSPRQFFGKALLWMVNGSFWKPVFERSSRQNKFIYLTENVAIKNKYGDVLSNVICLPLGTNKVERIISKTEARQHLGIPQEGYVFLCFGSPHNGKDWEVIYKALEGTNILLLQAGDQRLNDRSLNVQLPNSVYLSALYETNIRIHNKYISEAEKPYYFYASDAIILSYTKQFLGNASQLWEACRFELPVIISDNEQFRNIIANYKVGLVFKAQDADSLRETIGCFIDLSEEQELEFKDNCKRFNQDYSMDRWAKGCLLAYREL